MYRFLFLNKFKFRRGSGIKINLNKGFGEVLVPNIQRVVVSKPVLFGEVPVPGVDW